MRVANPGASRLSRHAFCVAAFAALAVIWTFPLVRHLSDGLPGPWLGDNVGFLWNFWWMRMALSAHADFFHTNFLFVPVGTDLTQHTHTALPALIGSTIFSRFPIVEAQNLTLLVSVCLNSVSAYVLSWHLTRDWGAAMIGGLIFGGSPYIASHLNGHFNLTTAWTIPLFAMSAQEAIQGSMKWAILGGLLLGATAYIDYYYVVFEIVLGICILVLAASDWSIAFRGPRATSKWPARLIGFLLVIDVGLIALIAFTGGIEGPIGPIKSMRDTFNLLQAFWVLLAVLVWLRVRPRVNVRSREMWQGRRGLYAIAVAGMVFVVVAAPLIWKVIGVLQRGEYVTQQYYWRSAPKGIDAATLFLGNPYHPIWGSSVQRIYAAFGIDAIEMTGWLGVAPILLAAWAIVGLSRASTGRTSTATRNWLAIGVVFFVWALGPHLMMFGVNTGMILPQALLRYIPIINNARIPGRAIVVVYLALSVLTAIAIAQWRTTSNRRFLLLTAVGFAVIADFLAAPFPVVVLKHPAVYNQLRDETEDGALCELPLGLRDGFGQHGAFDDASLFYQTIHQRPLVGGFVARLPPKVVEAYESDPLLVGLLNLSAAQQIADSSSLPDRQLAADRLHEDGIRFIVLDRNRASSKLVEYVERVLPLRLISEGDGRSLYIVER